MGEYVVSGGEVRAGQLVTLRADGTVSAAAPVDALGQPVPEWARDAYAVLSADGRRVFCSVGYAYTTDAPGGNRIGDAHIRECDHRVFIWRGLQADYASPWYESTGDTWSLSHNARHALAMESRGPQAHAPPTDPGPRPRCVAVPVPEPTGLVTCLRCGGPAGYLGIACQRVGGCRTAEERVAGMPRPGVVGYYSKRMREVVFVCGDSGEQQSSAAAIAAWRDAMLARERGR